MRSFLFSFLVALFLLPAFAVHAGPDVVNNGGGLSEAKAYSLLLNVSGFVRACLSSCALSARQTDQLTQLGHEFATAQYQIQFDNAFVASRLEGNLYKLSHRDLYDTNELSKSSGAIVALLLKLKAEQIWKDTNWIDFAFTRFEERTVSLPLGASESLHVIRFSDLSPVVILERPAESIALSPSIEAALGCSETYNLGDFSLVHFDDQLVMAEALVQWSCRGENLVAKLRLIDGKIQIVGLTRR